MKNLYAKLFAIQNLALAVSKDWTNPHFKSSYPTLDNTISVIIPEINKIWLLVTHFADWDTFVTRVVDIESWEALDSKYTLLGTTPQQRWSEQTYFRRYSMIALFNLPSEDDDAEVATAPAPVEKPWITKQNIENLMTWIKEWRFIVSSAEWAVKLARENYAVSKDNANKIMEEYKKFGL